MNETYIKNVIEAALLAAGRPLQLTELTQLFDENARPDEGGLRAAVAALEADYSSRGIEVKETSSGFRIQVRKDLANEVSRLWPERPPRYSRALLETLALIAYRQPITRAEIESVRGVAVNPNIIKTVIERNWVKVVGVRDVPGRPELLGTTQDFLDYFGLRSLDELPPLAELKAMGDVNLQLDLAKPEEGAAGASAAAAGDVSGAAAAGDAAGVAAAGAAAAAASGAEVDGAAAAAASGGEVDGAAAAVAGAEAHGAADNAADAVAADGATAGANAAVASGEAVASGAIASGEPVASDEAVTSGTVATPHESSDAAGSNAAVSDAIASNAIDAQPESVAVETSGDPVATPEHSEQVDVEPDAAAVAVAHMEIESDSGDVTVEVEALSLVEARIEATIEDDDENAAAGADEVQADDTHAARDAEAAPEALGAEAASGARAAHDATVEGVATAYDSSDTTLETGEFEMSELGVGADDAQASGEVIEAEFDAEDITGAVADSDDAEEADDEEELSASSSTATKFVAGPRDNDD